MTLLLLFGCVCPAASAQSDTNDLSAYYGFDEMEIIKLDWGIIGIEIADIDNDGRNDIIIPNNRRARIEVLLQKESIGPGEEHAALAPQDEQVNLIIPPTRFDSQPVVVSQKIYGIAVGDLNGDGMKDLAFYGEPKGLYIILQKDTDLENQPDARLSWRNYRKIKIDDGLLTPFGLVCADFDNDGRDDLALAAQKTIYLITQKDDGTLSEPVKFPTTSQTKGIEVTDIDGDSVNDLFMVTDASEKPIQVRFGSKNGQLGPQVELTSDMPWSLELFNIDDKTGDEILAVDSVSGRLLCYKLITENDDQSDWPILFYPLAAGEGSDKRDMVVADFDGDELPDIVISDPEAAELIYYKQISGFGLAEPKMFPAFSGINKLAAVDLDGDGKSELISLSIKEKVIGISDFVDDRLTFPKPARIEDEPVAIDIADIDDDGRYDCVYVSKDVNDKRWMHVIYSLSKTDTEQNSILSQQETELLAEDINTPPLLLEKLFSNPDGIKIVDADQDGLADVLVFDKYNPPPTFIRQTVKGKFEIITSTDAQSSLISQASPSSVDIADIDSKKGAELLVAQNNFARSLVFSDAGKWQVIDQYNAKSRQNNITAVSAFDISLISADNQPAILLLDGQKGQLQLLKPGEDKTYRFEKELDVGRWNSAANLKMLYAPMTGSDLKSIILFDSEKFAVITPPDEQNPPMHLDRLFSYETKIADGIYANLTAGDINSDKRTDIIMVEYKRKYIEILALDAQYKPVPAMRFKIFEDKNYREGDNRGKTGVEPRELRVADVTGDGKNDLIAVIHDRIIIYPQN